MKLKTRSENQDRKQAFIAAVKILASRNQFIIQVARRVPEDMIPQGPSVAAFELAATLDTLCKSWRLRRPLNNS